METQVINRNFPKFLIQILITTNLPQTPVKSQKEQANLSGVVLKKQGRDIRRFEWNALSLLSPRSLEVTPRTDTQGQPPGLQSQKVGSGGCWGKLGLLKASILKLFWGSLRHPSPQLVSFVRKLFWGQLSMTFKIYPGLLIWLLTYHARI